MCCSRIVRCQVKMMDFVFDRMTQLGVRPDELQFCIENGNAFYFRRNSVKHQGHAEVKDLFIKLNVYEAWKDHRV